MGLRWMHCGIGGTGEIGRVGITGIIAGTKPVPEVGVFCISAAIFVFCRRYGGLAAAGIAAANRRKL